MYFEKTDSAHLKILFLADIILNIYIEHQNTTFPILFRKIDEVMLFFF